MLGGHQAHDVETGLAQHVDGVASIHRHRGGVDDEAEPLAPQPEVLAGRDAVEPHADDSVVGEGQHRGVRDRRPGLADELVVAGRVDAVGEQDDEQLALRIDPDRGTRETGVAEGARGEERAGRRFLGRLGVPPQGPHRVVGARPAREELDRRSRDDPPVLEHASIEQHLAEAREIAGGREQPGVRCDPAEGERVLVVDLTAHQAAPPLVELGGGDPRQEVLAGAIERVSHRERPEHPLLHEVLQLLPGDPLEDLAEQDHAEVAVQVLGARLGDQVHGLNAREVGLRTLELLVQRRPPVDPRAVGEQVADGDRLLARALEERQVVLHLLVQIEAPFVDQDHRHRGRRHDLGQARQIVDRVRFDRRRVLVVGQPPEGTEVRQHAAVTDRDDPTREGPLLDEPIEHAVELLEPLPPEPGLLGRRVRQAHGAPREPDAVAEGVLFGERDRQPAPDVDLAEDRGRRRTPASLRGPEGAEGGRHLGQIAKHIRIAERGHDHRYAGRREPLEEPPHALRDLLAVVGGRHQHVRKTAHAAHDLVGPPGGDLAARGDGRDLDAPRLKLRARNAVVARHDEVQNPQGTLRRERQHFTVVADQGDRGLEDLPRPLGVLRAPHLEGPRLDVDQGVLVQPEARLGLQDAAHRTLEAPLGEQTLLDTADQRLQRHPQVGGHEDDIGARAHRVDGCLADPRLADPFHVHGVGDDETVEAHLAAQDLLVEGGGQRRGTAARVEAGHRDVAHHDRVHPGSDRRPEGRPLHELEAAAVAVDQGQVLVAVDGGVAVPREVLGRGHQPAAARTHDEGGAEPPDHLRVLAEGADVDHRVVGVVVDIHHRREGPVDAQRPAFPRRHLADEAGGLLGAGRADGHCEGQVDGAPGNAEGQATLHVHRHQERHPGLLLEAVEETRDRRLLGAHEDHAADPGVPDRTDEVERRRRPRVPRVAGLRDHDHLRRLLLEGHRGQGLLHPGPLSRGQLSLQGSGAGSGGRGGE